MMVYRVARVKDTKEDLLEEDNDLLLEVLAEVEEDTVEDGDREAQDGLLVGDTLL